MVLHWKNLVHLPKADINSITPSRQRHAVFHYFLSGDSKQDAATTTAHIKRLISLLKLKKYWQHNWVQYGKTMMVVPNNIYVFLNFTLCQLCLSVTPLELIEAWVHVIPKSICAIISRQPICLTDSDYSYILE